LPDNENHQDSHPLGPHQVLYPPPLKYSLAFQLTTWQKEFKKGALQIFPEGAFAEILSTAIQFC